MTNHMNIRVGATVKKTDSRSAYKATDRETRERDGQWQHKLKGNQQDNAGETEILTLNDKNVTTTTTAFLYMAVRTPRGAYITM